MRLLLTVQYFFLLLSSQSILASCVGVNYNLFSILHEKGTKYAAFSIRVDSTTLTNQYTYKAYATIIDNYSNPNYQKQIEIHSGGNTTAGGMPLFQGKYYFILGYEFEKGKFEAFVCDVHSKLLSENEDSSWIVKKMIHYKKHVEQKYTGKVKYYSDTILIAEGYLKGGIPNGRWKYYNWKGELLEDVKYKMGEKVGLKQYYNNGSYNLDNDKNKNSTIKAYLYSEETGALLQLITLKFDKHGNYTTNLIRYHENGKLRERYSTYATKDGYLNSPFFGRYEEYDKQGKIIAKGNYDRGAKVGKWIEQNTSDATLKTKIYPNIEKNNDRFIWFNADGKKNAEGKIHKRNKEGFWVYYDNKGDTLFCGIYLNNKKQGAWKEFFNGLNSITTYVDDIAHGEIIHFYTDSGKISGKGYKRNGVLFGEHKQFYKSGALKNITNYDEKGNIYGFSINYHENGKIESKERYIKNSIDGIYIRYDENGNIIEKGNYDNGLKVGEWLNFDKSGKLLKKCLYPYKPGILWEENCEYY